MAEVLPLPFVPADVDLRGLEYMPLLGGRLFGSNFDLDANDAEFRVGLRLWWAAWNQVPAGSLPAEDHRIRGLAGLGENPAKWKKVRARAMDGFVLCADGRLYHPIVAEQALIAWDKRAEAREERENEADRQRRLRADRKRLFAELRAAGITPKWDIGTTELRELHAKRVTPTVTPTVTVTSSKPVTVTSTAKTVRDVTRQEIPPSKPPRGATPVTLKVWLAEVRKLGEKAVPDDDPVFAYASEVELPHDFLALAWVEFRHRYTGSEPHDRKRYIDWRKVFRRAVRENWLKLWWLDGQSYALTTAGVQAQRANKPKDAA